MSELLHSKFGISWYGDDEDALDRADEVARGLMNKIAALHDKLYGHVALRVVLLTGFKFVYDNENNRALIGNDPHVFPGPDTPLFNRLGFAPEVYYCPEIMKWVTGQLTKQVQDLEAKYAAYTLALNKLATSDGTSFTVSTE